MSVYEAYKNLVSDNTEDYELKIKKNEELYDSLKEFQAIVRNSLYEFANVNSEKSKYLDDLKLEVSNCNTVTKYATGMEKVLNDVGVNSVKLVYLALLISIESKLKEYLDDIEKYEEKITSSNLLL